MAAQFDRLAMLAAGPHLDLRVLSFANTGPVWHDHGFTIKADRVDGRSDSVNLELFTGPANITEPGEVAEYRRAYQRLTELALRGPEAVAIVWVSSSEPPRLVYGVRIGNVYEDPGVVEAVLVVDLPGRPMHASPRAAPRRVSRSRRGPGRLRPFAAPPELSRPGSQRTRRPAFR